MPNKDETRKRISSFCVYMCTQHIDDDSDVCKLARVWACVCVCVHKYIVLIHSWRKRVETKNEQFLRAPPHRVRLLHCRRCVPLVGRVRSQTSHARTQVGYYCVFPALKVVRVWVHVFGSVTFWGHLGRRRCMIIFCVYFIFTLTTPLTVVSHDTTRRSLVIVFMEMKSSLTRTDTRIRKRSRHRVTGKRARHTYRWLWWGNVYRNRRRHMPNSAVGSVTITLWCVSHDTYTQSQRVCVIWTRCRFIVITVVYTNPLITRRAVCVLTCLTHRIPRIPWETVDTDWVTQDETKVYYNYRVISNYLYSYQVTSRS